MKNSKSFQKLKAKWYQKLKKSGFVDIEEDNSPKEMLKRWDSHYFTLRAAKSTLAYEAKRQYYSNASEFLNMYCFDTALEKRIWACHADGLSCKSTVTKLKLTSWRVHVVMKRLKAVFLGKG